MKKEWQGLEVGSDVDMLMEPLRAILKKVPTLSYEFWFKNSRNQQL